MPSFDDRIVKVGFEIDGQLKTFDKLYIAASGTKYANPNQDEAEVKIANLSAEDRNYLITQTSPYNKNRKAKRLVIEAGRVSTGTTRIYVGDILSCTPSQPPDIMLTIKAKTGQFLKGNIISNTQPSTATLLQLSKQVSSNIGASLQFEADDKQIANHSYSGNQLNQVNDLQETGDLDVFLDGNTLVVKNFNVPLSNQARILNASTGMIGIPEITEQGIKVKMLFDNKTVLGGGLIVSSEINPAVNGTYAIYKLSFDIANRDTQFYWVAEAKRLNR